MSAGNTGTRAMSGARTQKATDDFFPTPPSATQALLRREMFSPDALIWEPAAGRGDMSEVLKARYSNTAASDLYDQGAHPGCNITTGVDFLSSQPDPANPWDAVITNPPYSHAEQFVHKALEHVDPDFGRVCMLLRMAFLEGKGRRKTLFSVTPLARIWAFSGRQTMWKDGVKVEGAGSSAIFFAWFVWDRSHPIGAPATISFADEV